LTSLTQLVSPTTISIRSSLNTARANASTTAPQSAVEKEGPPPYSTKRPTPKQKKRAVPAVVPNTANRTRSARDVNVAREEREERPRSLLSGAGS
jgi:hypothetical protein